MERALKLSEKLFCLAVNPTKGGVLMSASAALSMTLAGSVFVELMKKDLITIQKGVVHLVNPMPLNDEIYEFFLNPIRLRAKDRKLRAWISYFNARGRKIKKLFVRNLVFKNLLRTEEKRFLFIPYQKVYLVDRACVESIRKDVEAVCLGKAESSDETLILAMMVAQNNLLPRVFPDKAQRKQAARYLKKLPETDVSKAVQEAIEMMQAAVFVAVT